MIFFMNNLITKLGPLNITYK